MDEKQIATQKTLAMTTMIVPVSRPGTPHDREDKSQGELEGTENNVTSGRIRALNPPPKVTNWAEPLTLAGVLALLHMR